MRRILMMCGAIVISILFTQIAVAQDNNQSISDDLKKVWGDPGVPSGNGLNMDGMYDTQAESDDTGDIDFNDNVSSLPIDGGISLLLAAGLGYGANRLRRRKKDKKAKNY